MTVWGNQVQAVCGMYVDAQREELPVMSRLSVWARL